MRICHILPLPYLIDNRFKDLNNYHLVEFHAFINNSEYASYYKQLDKNKHFIILDCSVGVGATYDIVSDTPLYLEVAKELSPHELVVPDVLQNNFETMCLLHEFLPEAREKLKNIPLKFLGVLQLDNISDLSPTIAEFANCGIDTLGIPWKIDFEFFPGDPGYTAYINYSSRLIPPDNVTRKRVINRLVVTAVTSAILKMRGFDIPVHLLGCADAIEYIYQRYGARGTDTSTAYMHALNDIVYTVKGLLGEKAPGYVDFNSTVNDLVVPTLISNISMIDRFITP